MPESTVSILDGSSFVVSDRRGDIDARRDQAQGFFFQDTRHLSRWRLTLDGVVPDVLSTDTLEYYFAQFFLVPPTGTIYENPYVSVIRRRRIGEVLLEHIEVLNHHARDYDLVVAIDADADFADLFEVKDQLPKKGERYRRIEGNELVLGYRREDFVRETRISAHGAELVEQGLRFRARIPPKSRWEAKVELRPATAEKAAARRPAGRARANTRAGFQDWLEAVPRISADPPAIVNAYRRSVVDLAALRFYPAEGPERSAALFPEGASVPAAGLPWFMALFGRDSLLTSYQSLPFVPELARTTLQVLAATQGKTVDPFRDEEPGKILHELRFGELTHFEERPQSPYYGAADTTPLFLVLLDEYERWTGDGDLVRALEAPARAALEWIDRHGDRDGDGYVEYRRARETGLENQCWKDSGNSILFRDGTIAPSPRATCEIQGYVYDAKARASRLARSFWGDEPFAERLASEAGELKRRFNQDFWMPARDYFAVALDGHKRQVDSLTSNPGHLLWSGIVDDDKVEPVVRHLMGPGLFSGWGIRTMAVGEAGYNPIEYHNGTVWPHDTSIIAAGLARCGHREEASRLCGALFGAALHFRFRLPEVFAGYDRAATAFPVEYPTASSPQAWAAGAPLLAIRTMLGLEPQGDHLAVDPVLPDTIRRLEVRGILGRWGQADAKAERPDARRFEDVAREWFAARPE
ncbi:MAG TPA: glycogen debranching N-terminal domain-containing protein [Anaeromyxobacteraceae bacterium]|nr:glycogen debranching N-terminal domain-containing protein [Anaeromyxobacteraceae bacterium]